MLPCSEIAWTPLYKDERHAKIATAVNKFSVELPQETIFDEDRGFQSLLAFVEFTVPSKNKNISYISYIAITKLEKIIEHCTSEVRLSALICTFTSTHLRFPNK